MTRPTVLVVDDEIAIHRFLRPVLAAEGYRVVEAATGADALKLAANERPDAVLLDLGLPDLDGKEVLVRLRRLTEAPVVVLSARDRESEKVRALDLGADDYVEKPFGVGELAARLRAALRHARPGGTSALHRSGDVTLDVAAHVVRKGEREVRLTRREFEVLLVLFRSIGKVVTHAQLLREVWGTADGADTQYLRVYVGQLRGKLEDDPAAPRLILTEPGIGYRLV